MKAGDTLLSVFGAASLQGSSWLGRKVRLQCVTPFSFFIVPITCEENLQGLLKIRFDDDLSMSTTAMVLQL